MENIRKKLQTMVMERDEARDETEKVKKLCQDERDRGDRV